MSAVSRRNLLKAGTALGGGLVIGAWLPTAARAENAVGPRTFRPNAFIRVTPDDRVQFVLSAVEMGQGVTTSHAMMVAEELNIAPAQLECLFAEADRAYDNPAIGYQMTGGSTSVRTSWVPLRTAAATAREMLIGAAAATWKVPATECVAEGGAVLHRGSGKTLRYGALAEAAAQQPVPTVTPKTKGFRVIGQSIDRLDAKPKVNGTAVYGMDVTLPGLRVAVVIRSPVFTGKVKSFDAEKAKASPGVEAVVELPSGVAIVAQKYWQAQRAAKLLKVEWEEGWLGPDDSKQMLTRYRAALKSAGQGKRIRDDGDVADGFKGAAKTIEAEYFAPYVAHATMEPQNATASFANGRLEVWSGAQGGGGPLNGAIRASGLSADEITVHQCWAGGGFGRRSHVDFIDEAVRLTMALKGPVKVIWSRTDDMQHDFYRPMAVNLIRGAVSAEGKITAWHHRTATQSIVATVAKDLAPPMFPSGLPAGLRDWLGARAGNLYSGPLVDETAVEGANSLPYDLPNLAVDYVQMVSGVPVGFWRSVGHSHQAFVVEGFIDELAHAAGQDPFEFRRALLAKKDRHRGVLELVAKKAGWGSPLPAGVFRGIAQHASFSSFAAAVAEVSVEGTQIKVHRMVMGIDCGIALNPDILKAQLESCAIYGLSSALKHQITVKQGRVEQTNFHDFELLRMHEAPTIEAHVVPSEAAPSGAGEPGVPVVAPAVANAIFAATGQRLRAMPLKLT